MALSGTIEARVMGGIKNYEDAFFNETFMKESPQNSEDVLMLKRTIIEQVCYLAVALHTLYITYNNRAGMLSCYCFTYIIYNVQ